MTTARAFHSATLLRDGRVLIAGGVVSSDFSIATETAEIYNPATGTFASATPMDATFSPLTATLLSNGKVLVVGESADTPNSRATVYDPDLDSWSPEVAVTGLSSYHDATLLPSGEVLFTGKAESSQLYDPDSERFFEGPSLGAGLGLSRSHQTATLLPSGAVLLAGGQRYGAGGQAETEPFADAWIYLPIHSTSSATRVPARAHHTATYLPRDKVLIAGGRDGGRALDSCELYFPADESTFVEAAKLPEARSHHSATLLPDGTVLIAGGLDSSGAPMSSLLLYVPDAGTGPGAWTWAGSLAQGRSGHTATLLSTGQVLFTGGQGIGGVALVSAELYDPGPGIGAAVRQIAGLHEARIDHTATLLPSGQGPGGRRRYRPRFSAGLGRVDPLAGTWTLSSTSSGCSAGAPAHPRFPCPLAAARARHSATRLPNGNILFAGGQSGPGGPTSYFDSSEVYDPATGLFSSAGPMQQHRMGHRASNT